MRYRLEKEFRFEASHQLIHHDGKCARLHGHSWRGKIVIEGDHLVESGPKKGMLMDYYELGVATKMIEELLDHRHLNEVVDAEAPTSERIAGWVLKKLQGKVDMLTEVFISETCTTSCTVRREK